MRKLTLALAGLLLAGSAATAADYTWVKPEVSTSAAPKYYKIASNRILTGTNPNYSSIFANRPWMGIYAYNNRDYAAFSTSTNMPDYTLLWYFDGESIDGELNIRNAYNDAAIVGLTGKNSAIVAADAAKFYVVELPTEPTTVTKNGKSYTFNFDSNSFCIGSSSDFTASNAFFDVSNFWGPRINNVASGSQSSTPFVGALFNEWNPVDDCILWGNTNENFNNGSIFYFAEATEEEIAVVEAQKAADFQKIADGIIATAKSELEALISDYPFGQDVIDAAVAELEGYSSEYTNLADLNNAIGALQQKTVETLIAQYNETYIDPYTGKYIYITNNRRAETIHGTYLYAKEVTVTVGEGEEGTQTVFNTEEKGSYEAVWMLNKVTDTNYYTIHNISSGLYIGANGTPAEEALAASFSVKVSDDVFTFDFANGGNALNIDTNGNNLTTWSNTDAGSKWGVSFVETVRGASPEVTGADPWDNVFPDGISTVTVHFSAGAQCVNPADAVQLYTVDFETNKISDTPYATAKSITFDESGVMTATFEPTVTAYNYFAAVYNAGCFYQPAPEGYNAGFFYDAGVTSSAVWNIYIPDTEVEMALTPDQGLIEELTEIKLQFPGDPAFYDINLSEDFDWTTTITLSKDNTVIRSWDAEDIYNDCFDFDTYDYVITGLEYTEPGTYVLHIPARFFCASELGWNKETNWSWTIAEAATDGWVRPQVSTAANPKYYKIASNRVLTNTGYSVTGSSNGTFDARPWMGIYNYGGKEYAAWSTNTTNMPDYTLLWYFDGTSLDAGDVVIRNAYNDAAIVGNKGASATIAADAAPFYVVELPSEPTTVTKNGKSYTFNFDPMSFCIGSSADFTANNAFFDVSNFWGPAGANGTQSYTPFVSAKYNEWNPVDDWIIWWSAAKDGKENVNNGAIFYFTEATAAEIAVVEAKKAEDYQKNAEAAIASGKTALEALINTYPDGQEIIDAAVAELEGYGEKYDNLADLNNAIGALQQKTVQALIAQYNTKYIDPLTENFIYITSNRRTTAPYLYAKEDTEEDEAVTVFNTEEKGSYEAVWMLNKIEETNYYSLRNIATGLYIGAGAAPSETPAQLSVSASNDVYTFEISGANALNVDTSSNNLTTWSASDGGSKWGISMVDVVETPAPTILGDDGEGWVYPNGIRTINCQFAPGTKCVDSSVAVSLWTVSEAGGLGSPVAVAESVEIDENGLMTAQLPELIISYNYFAVILMDESFFKPAIGNETAGAFYDLGVSEEALLNFYVPDQDVDMDITPAEGIVKSIDEIVFNLAGDPYYYDLNFTEDYDYDTNIITLSKDGEEVESWDAYAINENFDNSTWLYTLTDLGYTEPGKYTLHIPARFFGGQTGWNKETDWNWTIEGSSITELSVTVDGKTRVYDVQGRRATTNSRGLLIIDGKKALKK